MSSPFNPDEWPEGYGPGNGYTGPTSDSGAGGDDAPPYDDEDAPVDDEAVLPVDPATGVVGEAGGKPPGAGRKPKTEQEDPAKLDVGKFLAWVRIQLGMVESYQANASDKPAWCSEWFRHPEVVERLVVAYQAYAKSSKSQHEGDMLALSSWWVQHWDHHARVIFDPTNGPFRACGYDGHLSKVGDDRTTLAITPEDPPEGWAP